VALVELLDLEGELALAEIVAEQSNGSVRLEDLLETLEDGSSALFGDLGLNDDGEFVFPHTSSSRTSRRVARSSLRFVVRPRDRVQLAKAEVGGAGGFAIGTRACSRYGYSALMFWPWRYGCDGLTESPLSR
jgi:hypothetical protein